jgi:hypothetical protein
VHVPPPRFGACRRYRPGIECTKSLAIGRRFSEEVKIDSPPTFQILPAIITEVTCDGKREKLDRPILPLNPAFFTYRLTLGPVAVALRLFRLSLSFWHKPLLVIRVGRLIWKRWSGTRAASYSTSDIHALHNVPATLGCILVQLELPFDVGKSSSGRIDNLRYGRD